MKRRQASGPEMGKMEELGCWVVGVAPLRAIWLGASALRWSCLIMSLLVVLELLERIPPLVRMPELGCFWAERWVMLYCFAGISIGLLFA